MLVQEDEILDVCQDPNFLMWCCIEDNKDFHVAVGVINEEGRREVVGTCADFRACPCMSECYITSDVDGFSRLLGKASPSDTVRNRVCTLYCQGKLNDPCCFSKVLMWED
jgi:hypothetical protein